jgi:3-methylcrotonyl-CoA carboxylase beta subunit
VTLQSPRRAAYDPEEILGVVPADLRTPYDIREVIARIVDGSRFDEFKARFGETLVCGFAHVFGCPWGSSPTTACCSPKRAEGRAFRRALLAAPNPAGLPAEHHRLHGRPQIRERRHRRHGAKLVTAVATAAVPKITMLVGGSFGAGNYGMCGARLLSRASSGPGRIPASR